MSDIIRSGIIIAAFSIPSRPLSAQNMRYFDSPKYDVHYLRDCHRDVHRGFVHCGYFPGVNAGHIIHYSNIFYVPNESQAGPPCYRDLLMEREVCLVERCLGDAFHLHSCYRWIVFWYLRPLRGRSNRCFRSPYYFYYQAPTHLVQFFCGSKGYGKNHQFYTLCFHRRHDI